MGIYKAKFGKFEGHSFVSAWEALVDALGEERANKICDNTHSDNNNGYRPITRYYAKNDKIVGYIKQDRL